MARVNELLEQMNAKKDPDELKTKEIVFSKGVLFDYYRILGVDETASQLDIKRAYQSKLKKLHPDKIAQTPENIAKYKLLREAGDLLSDPHERKAYDAQKKQESISNDFSTQRDTFKEFIKLQEQTITAEDKQHAKLSFDQELAKYTKDTQMSTNESSRRVEDMMLQREQDELEATCENVFEGRQFNQSEFNKLFDRKQKKHGNGIVKYQGDILAANDMGGDSYCSAIESNYMATNDVPYDPAHNSPYDPTNDMSSIDSDPDDSADALADAKLPDLEAIMKQMMASRAEQDALFDSMQPSEYGSAIDDKYGVSSQLGFMVGDKLHGHQKPIVKRNVKEITAYKQLTI
jgi:hypothetical protein